MATLWVLLLVVPFFIPIHFYPVPTYPEELIAALLLVSLVRDWRKAKQTGKTMV